MGRRGFTGIRSMAEHDDQILDNINNLVKKTDTLYILGDFALDRPARFKERIVCQNIFFIIGNHDKKELTTWAFGTVYDLLEVKLNNGNYAYCSHYPMAFWDRSHKGSYHFYGHMHAQRETFLDCMFPDRRSMDVGVDNAYRLKGKHEPFSELELLDLLSTRKGHDDLQFYKDYQLATADAS